MNLNDAENGTRSMAGNWAGAIIVGALGILAACFWYLLSVSNQLQDSSTKIVTLQQQVHELSILRDSQIKDEGQINQNLHDIEDLKRRVDLRAK